MLTARQAAALAARVLASRFGEARCGFAAGSLIRGDGTAGSDLDLVLLFGRLPRAGRRSFWFEGWPVEAFLHDEETLAWALANDARSGRPAMLTMVGEGRIIGPAPELGRHWRGRARRALRAGPGPLDAERRDRLRYHISDRVDDLRDPRPAAELTAVGVSLYEPLAQLALRSRGAWSASGKWIPRALQRADPALATAFAAAFDALFAHADAALVIALAEAITAPVGGLIFDGYEANWPPDRRLAP